LLKIGLVNGSPKANSSTLMPAFLAAKKCPVSWTKTKTERININTKKVIVKIIT